MNSTLFPVHLHNVGGALVETLNDWEITYIYKGVTTTLKLPNCSSQHAYDSCIWFDIPVEDKNFRWYKKNPDITVSRNGHTTYPQSIMYDCY